MARPGKQKVQLSDFEKLASKIGGDWRDVLAELEAMEVESLNKRIAQANQAIATTKEELEADLPNGDMSPYMKAKGNIKILGEALREVKKRQNAIIAVSVKLRQEKGAV